VAEHAPVELRVTAQPELELAIGRADEEAVVAGPDHRRLAIAIALRLLVDLQLALQQRHLLLERRDALLHVRRGPLRARRQRRQRERSHEGPGRGPRPANRRHPRAPSPARWYP
jgi:hypothetical protein